MKVHEYLKTVEEQIRCKSIWEDIRTELLGHIEEDTEYFRRKGMSREEAVERAVEEMGDPVETGIELDKVHRTRLDVKLLLLCFFRFFLSIGSAMGVPSIFIIFFWGRFFICTGTIRYCLRRSCPQREQLDCAVYGNSPGCSERDMPGCFFLTGDLLYCD